MKKQVLHQQSLFDFVLQHCGTLASALLIASANGISVTDVLTPGMFLTIPDDAVLNMEIVTFFEQKNYVLATSISSKGSSNNYQFAYQLPIRL